MQQQTGSFDVPQKPIAQAMTLVRAFDQTRDVSHNESAKIPEIDDSQMRFKRRKGIVRDFWLSRRNRGDKSRLAGIRKTDQADVRQQLQFKLQVCLLTGTAFLMVTRRAIG